MSDYIGHRHRDARVTQWYYWQGNGLVVHSSLVQVLASLHCIVALGKLITPVCLCHQAV